MASMHVTVPPSVPASLAAPVSRPSVSRTSLNFSRCIAPVRVFATSRRIARPQSQSALRVVAEKPSTTTAAGVVTDSTFDELVLKSPVPVLLDFWAPWCGPCRMIAPLIDEIAAEYGGRVRALKLNTDESPGVATEYGIRSIPTVMFFKDGQKLETVIGAVPKSTLVRTLEKYIT